MTEYIFFGLMLGVIYDIIIVIVDFFRNETWLVPKYEKIIYHLINDETEKLTLKDLDTMSHAVFEYSKELIRENKRKNFKSKIKSLFKKGE